MSKTAFLFPGQGSQSPGMGQELAKNFTAAHSVFEAADKVLGYSLSEICFEGPTERLQLTENAQPAILAVSVATLAVVHEKGLQADYVAGHSLGEYSALVAAGALSFKDALQLVHKRGGFMQEAVPSGVGMMAALIGISSEKVEQICSQSARNQIVTVANLNTPVQTVISGHCEAVERAIVLAKLEGAKKAVILNVSAPFHCSLMSRAQQQMKPELDMVRLSDLQVPLINNWQAAEVRTKDDAREGLKQQIPNPVRWEETIRYLKDQGVSKFIEIGPGNVLTGFLKRIDRKLVGKNTSDLASLEGLLN